MLFSAFVVLILLNAVQSDDINHKYSEGEAVTLWVNTVGPYHNPQETYPYYKLPFCKPFFGIETKKRPSGIGEILEGNELRNSGVKLLFSEHVDNEDICQLILEKDTVQQFERAIDQQYWYELFIDDLPLWGMVGEILRDDKNGIMERHIFTHRSITLLYNKNRIIEANLTSENPIKLEVGAQLHFTYTVHWETTAKTFSDRFSRYLEYDFFEHKIHWFSVFNSLMMVVFLCGLVSLILLRTLRNDFARYAKEDDMDLEGIQGIGEDSGWKQIYGDVFRAPKFLVLFSALYGTGSQLLFLVLGVILYAMAGPILHGNMYEDRGEMMSTFIVCFALSSVIGGYTNGSYYKKYFPTPRAESKSQWQSSMVCTILLFPTVLVIVVGILNFIAIYYDTVNAIPFSVIAKMFVIWGFVSVPLNVLGTIFGRHWVSKNDIPCRVNSIPRPIPLAPWYGRPTFIIPLAGFLPFGSIFIELYFMFTAFWSYKFYYVYGFMLLVYIILAMVTVCTTIVSVYFVLNSENHHWQWIALFSAGSTAVYVFLYSVFYFIFKTQMSGMLQICYYFGYMALFSFSLFLICGVMGLFGASIFVAKIYRDVKID